MAESQLACLDDGTIGAPVPATRAEFYYSEEQRGAVEELLRNGDSAFKTRLQADHMTDFLSAREVKLLLSTFARYDPGEESPGVEQEQEEEEARSDLRSTYWPQMSDTEVPPLDLGWSGGGGGLFRGVTRVAVHTHPPKENGPHIREVVRRLIQEARKLIAIVMDMITDPHILQDLMDAASRRSVSVYILLNRPGVPHFLDMCNRLQIGRQHLQNIRARVLEGMGLGLSFGRIPGQLCYKYMLVDGDKVMFGSYSFSWCTSRMDRNMITVMSGQVVDVFDRDFRELYAVSEKLNLYREFHVNPPANKNVATTPTKLEPKRPFSPVTTSRFQVSLGDSPKADIQVPAHKYHNPKYLLVTGDIPRPTSSLQELTPKMRQSILDDVSGEMNPERGLAVSGSEKMDRLSPLLSQESLKEASSPLPDKGRWTLRKKKLFGKTSSRLSLSSQGSGTCPSPAAPAPTDEAATSRKASRKSAFKSMLQVKKMGRVASEPVIDSSQDSDSHKGRKCTVS